MNKTNERVFLSICIPSYNRKDRLIRLIREISRATSDDFEIFILDNHSDEDFTNEIELMDYRIRMIRKDINNGGMKNIIECILGGEGTYSLLCLDKDLIVGEMLDEFIKKLKETRPFCGVCKYISRSEKNNDKSVVFNKNQLAKTAFVQRHPTGYFYKTDLCRSEVIKYDLDNEPLEFFEDVLLTCCAAKGDFLLYKSGLVKEGGDGKECRRQRSFSYSSEMNNIWFMPNRRSVQLQQKIEWVFSSDVPRVIKNRLVKKFSWNYVYECTYALKAYLQSESLCYHYFIEPRIMDDEELKLNYLTAIEFIKYQKIIRKINKNITCLILYLKLRFFYVRLKKMVGSSLS